MKNLKNNYKTVNCTIAFLSFALTAAAVISLQANMPNCGCNHNPSQGYQWCNPAQPIRGIRLIQQIDRRIEIQISHRHQTRYQKTEPSAENRHRIFLGQQVYLSKERTQGAGLGRPECHTGNQET